MLSSKHQQYIVGLTGGIGSGKTTACNFFADLGVDIIDADLIAREVVPADSPALNSISQYFGKTILTHSGELNRSRLRQIIFNNADKRKWLENLLHPLIRENIFRQIDTASSEYVILSAPLLLENDHYNFVNRVLVLDIPEEKQAERVAVRDDISLENVREIMATQMSRNERLALADDVILNNDTVSELRHKVQGYHDFYKQQSAL